MLFLIFLVLLAKGCVHLLLCYIISFIPISIAQNRNLTNDFGSSRSCNYVKTICEMFLHGVYKIMQHLLVLKVCANGVLFCKSPQILTNSLCSQDIVFFKTSIKQQYILPILYFRVRNQHFLPPSNLGLWSSPEMSGERASPRAHCTLTAVDAYTLLMFGGRNKNKCFNDAYILDFASMVCAQY